MATGSGSVGVSQTKTLLLFGKTGSGKSATGNTILGDKKFKVSSKGQTTQAYEVATCEVAGLALKIIDTPDITENKEGSRTYDPMYEVARWIVEAEDGLHALLFVHHFGVRFSDQQRDVFQALEDSFGKEIFQHMIVVLTYGDEFERVRDEEGITLDGYLSDKWNGLSKLMERVNNRHVVFDNRTKDEAKRARQVDELMNCLKNVMVANGGQPYRSKYLSAIVPGAKQSSVASTSSMQAAPLSQEQAQHVGSPSDAKEEKETTRNLLLFGKAGSGKSATGNTIIGAKEFNVSSKANTTKTCEAKTRQLFGITLKVIDTPDITDDTQDPTKEVSKWFQEANGSIHALLLVHRFGERFKDQQRSVYSALERFFGPEIFKHTIVIFTFGDEAVRVQEEEGVTMGSYLADEWNGLDGLMKRVRYRWVLFDNRTKDQEKKEDQLATLMSRIQEVLDEHHEQPYRCKIGRHQGVSFPQQRGHDAGVGFAYPPRYREDYPPEVDLEALAVQVYQLLKHDNSRISCTLF